MEGRSRLVINDLFTLYTWPLCNLVDVRWLTSLAFVGEQTNKTVDSVSVWSRIDAGIDVIRSRKISRWYDIFKAVDIDIKNFMLLLVFLLDLELIGCRLELIELLLLFLHFVYLRAHFYTLNFPQRSSYPSWLDTLKYIDQLIKKI